MAANPRMYIQCDQSRSVPCEPEILDEVTNCYGIDEAVEVSLAGAVTETADTIQITIKRDVLPAALQQLLDTGNRVTDAFGYTGRVVAGNGINAGGPCPNFSCESWIGDWTKPAKPFEIGS
jgi:hypothetical protein